MPGPEVRLDSAVVVASHNPDKIAEIEEVLGQLGIPIAHGHVWPEIAETGATLEANAILKARAVAAHTGLPAIGDDTGLEVAALGGAPGVHTARYAGPHAKYADNVAKLLRELEGSVDRRARFRTAVALAEPQGGELVVAGSLDGQIVHRRRGSGGFGYDPVFEVDGTTLAEMTADEKHKISHRARALRALAEMLGIHYC